MSNRAHHPADHESGGFSADERLTPEQSGPIAVNPSTVESGAVQPEAVQPGEAQPGGGEDLAPEEYVVPLTRSVERALARDEDASDDDDEQEVVPEPDSVDQPLEGRVVPPELPPSAEAMEGVPVTGVSEPQRAASDALTPLADAVTPLPHQELAASARPVEEAIATRQVPAGAEATFGEAAAPGPRRISRPPPLSAARAADELGASRGPFTGATATEVTAAELESAVASSIPSASRSGTPGEAAADPAGAKRPSFRAPWVDEVPDPVTPYEQRNSDTVKVADLPPVEQLRGRVLANRYLAEEVAEHTACSISYRAYHLALDRAVTVRVLLRGLACSDEACQEVRRVAAIASALENEHVASTLDFGVLSDGWPFVVTEHFQGSTLAALLSKEGKFVLRRVLHIGKQVALGLSAAHEQGILHGLLSPDNVLVVEPGSSAEIAKILGFGISKARGSVPGPPRSGVFGIPFYVSPEQAACRPIDARSDIYSLGVILYELMAGAPPFSDGDFAGVLCQHLDDDSPPPSSRLPSPGALAKALDAIVERCLKKEPEKRYQTAAELAEDLIRLEAAAARTKRRPMPEVQKPTTTIHSPHPKLEVADAPGAKVIVHDDVDDPVSPEAPEVSARRSSPSLTQSSSTTPGSGSPKPAAVSSAARSRPTSRPPPTPMTPTRGPLAKPARVRVDQATIKISAVDRERLLAERPHGNGSWLGSVVAAIRRLIATDPGGNDDTR
jgi:eukaryotic-like serine/threonine-protein kinase